MQFYTRTNLQSFKWDDKNLLSSSYKIYQVQMYIFFCNCIIEWVRCRWWDLQSNLVGIHAIKKLQCTCFSFLTLKSRKILSKEPQCSFLLLLAACNTVYLMQMCSENAGLTFVMCLQLWDGVNHYFADRAVEELLCFLLLRLSWRGTGSWGRRVWIRRGVTEGRKRGWRRGRQRRADRRQKRTLWVCWDLRWEAAGGQRWLFEAGRGLGVI